ncbi:F-box/kelch-repeat protein At1g22040-like [Musa acuminata AAA Group]|uniref:F-box/kelch-repeat protein At1g22040-like n=1 Tax=Musa acuminata AAA Group TaxID=214697 RepID=UPI0031DA6D80
MGSFLSVPAAKSGEGVHCETSRGDANKKIRISSYFDDNPRLIPSLPDEVSIQILARLPRIHYLNVKLVSRRWMIAVMSGELFQLRRQLGVTEEWLYVMTKTGGDKYLWQALDPRSGKWQRLPPMPHVVDEERPKRGLPGFWMWGVVGSSIKLADFIRGWLGRRDNLDQMPFCGCAVGVVNGCLYVLGGFSRASAINCVWRYDPCLNLWQEVSSMTSARAFCKTGILNDKLYVVGGVVRGRNGLIPLRTAEVFDPLTSLWTELPSMPFVKTQVLPTAFLADMLKPIATGLVSYRGRLCVPQSLYSWPFFFDIGGEIYDPETSSWVEMPHGMGDGWPARQAGTKLGTVVNGDLYALDPASCLDNGKIKKYDYQEDVWRVVIENVPVRYLTDSESPFLLAGLLGKLHVIMKDANHHIVILEADLQRRTGSNVSTSSTAPADSMTDNPVSLVEEEPEFWKVIDAKDSGVAELVSCQVLDI